MLDKITLLFLAATQSSVVSVDELVEQYMTRAERNVEDVAAYLDLMSIRRAYNNWEADEAKRRSEALHLENVELLNQQRRLA